MLLCTFTYQFLWGHGCFSSLRGGIVGRMVTLFNCLRPCQIALADTPTCDVLRSQFLHMAFTYECYFCWIQNPSRQFFSSCSSKLCIHCHLVCIISDVNSVFSYLCSLYIVSFFFFPDCFSDFPFLFLVYINLIIMCLGGWVSRCVCVCFYPALSSLSFLNLCIKMGIFGFILSQIFSPPPPTPTDMMDHLILSGRSLSLWVTFSWFSSVQCFMIIYWNCGATLGGVCILLLSFKEFGVLFCQQ